MLAAQQRAWWLGREAAYYACALAGSGLIVAVGLLYRIDLVKRGNWPSMTTGWISTAVFLASLGLLTVAWIGLSQLCRGRTLFGQTLPGISNRTRIVVFHASSGKLQSGYFGMLTQGFPQLVRVNADVIRPDPSRSFPERAPVICQVRMVNETPLIPDLARLEQMIAEETSVMN